MRAFISDYLGRSSRRLKYIIKMDLKIGLENVDGIHPAQDRVQR
jgi:hypothetical protein